MTTFAELGLIPELCGALERAGYTTPTPIQQRAIPALLDGGDVLAAAQTGTGKTAAFALPLLQRLHAQGRGSRAPRVLILCPTRELAAQIDASIQKYGTALKIRSTVIFGGVGQNPQVEALRRGVDMLVATPGRLLDLHGQGALDLSQLQTLVLDEADRMLDMGFIHDIRRVLKLLPAQRQNLLFSATFSKDIERLARGLLRDPLSIDVAPRNAPAEAVTQHALDCDKGDKRRMLSALIRGESWRQTLVFTRTKHGANRLAKQLMSDGLTAAAIHGNKSQTARTKALAGFKDGNIDVLVATDIAARGIDIKELPQVVNYELPNVPADYVHRIGRTGRAQASGQAVSLVDAEESKLLRDIERLLGRKLPRMSLSEAAREAYANPPTPIEVAPEAAPQRPAGARKPRPPRGDGQAPAPGRRRRNRGGRGGGGRGRGQGEGRR